MAQSGAEAMRNAMGRASRLTMHAVGAGADVARDAWRDVSGVLALSSLAGASVFVADHADLPREIAQSLHFVGWTALALLLAPKLGALFRVAVGGEALWGLGGGGLQWKRLEWRLLATVVALAGLSLILAVLFLLTVMAVLTVLRPLGVIDFGPLGPLGIGFLLTAPLLVGLGALIFAGVARLALTLPAEAVEQRPRFARGWLVTRGAGLPVAMVGAAVFVAPLLALCGLQMALDWLQAGDGAVFGGRGWPLVEASVAGLGVAALAEFVWAPLWVGAVVELYLILAPPAKAATRDADAKRAARSIPSSRAVVTRSPNGRDMTPPAQTAKARGASEPRRIADGSPARTLPDVRAAASAATVTGPAPAPSQPRLRLVHSIDEIAVGWPPLAPRPSAREAGAGPLSESQEP